MKKVVLVVGCVIFFIPFSYAWECEYGEAKAWIKLYGSEEWLETPVKNVLLRTYEPFEVKVEVKTKTECDVVLWLTEPGITKAYEVVSGERKIGTAIINYNCPSNWSKTYRWVVRPSGNWTEGYAPLNIFVQFTKSKNYQQIDRTIEKTLILAYISPEEWKGSENGNDGGGNNIPGFEITSLLLSFCLIIWKRKK